MTATPTRPTTDEIQRIIDVVNLGENVEDAIEAIYGPDRPSPANSDVVAAGVAAQKEAQRPKPTVMLTEFPDGIFIGWDRCAILNGGCGESVAKCKCKGGPKEARVFEEWRTGVKQMPEYGKATIGTAPVSRGVSRKATTPALTNEEAREAISTTITKTGQVKCAIHGDFVDQAEADENDDHTWTCFVCQESGAQRGVQVDG